MNTRQVDCRGLNCPQPVINTKNALQELTAGRLTVLVDNPVARQNVVTFAQNAGHKVVENREEQGIFYITIEKDEQNTTGREEQQAGGSQKPIYFFTSNTLGQGSPDLGSVLMQSLLKSLAEAEPKPEALIFLNSGVYLVCEGSEVLPQLQKLAEAGTKILACGTCLDYYRLKEKTVLGTVSNMFEINNLISGPHKVITIS